MNRKKSGGGARKIGRNKVKCERYRRENRKVRNQIRRWKKYLVRHPNDKQLARRLQSVV